MWLEPVEFGRGDWADVQAINVRCVGQLTLPLLAVCERGRHECLADLREDKSDCEAG